MERMTEEVLGMARRKGDRRHVWMHRGGPMLVDRSDGRWEEYREAQKRTGVSPDECWNLDMTFACFMVPRLKAFREMTCGYPGALSSMEEWHGILDRVIDGLELMSEDRVVYSDDERERIERGLDLFREWIQGMWW